MPKTNYLQPMTRHLRTSWLGTKLQYKSQPNERFIGLGENGGLDRRGKAYVNWNTDNFAYPTDGDPLPFNHAFYIGINDGRPCGLSSIIHIKPHSALVAPTSDLATFKLKMVK